MRQIQAATQPAEETLEVVDRDTGRDHRLDGARDVIARGIVVGEARRFNRRTSRSRGLVFRRLLEQAVVTGPVTEADVTHGYDW